MAEPLIRYKDVEVHQDLVLVDDRRARETSTKARKLYAILS